MTRTLRALLALVVVSLGLVLVVDAPAFACSCKQATFAQQVERADVVFVATVDSVSSQTSPRVYELTARRTYKGTVEHTTQVQSGSGSCGLGTLETGKAYVFLATGTAAPYSANQCGGTAATSPRLVTKVERILGTGQVVAPPPPPTATRTKVETGEPYGFARLAAPGGAAVIVGLLGLLVVRQFKRR